MDTTKHPCFNAEAKHKYGRVHLPVAPHCNVQCNFCNRKYDCANESRPGVTSVVLSPAQAVVYLRKVFLANENITVVGIAGPGDPFANPKETMETIRLAKAEFPDKLFCLSSNGLEIAPHIDELAELGVSHVTITVNAIDVEILAKIYAWIRLNKKIYRGVQAGEIIMERQLDAISKLKAKGITVKVNSIVIPGINDQHIPTIAKAMGAMGVDTFNCIPLVANKETEFENNPEPTKGMMALLFREVAKYIKPMAHCSRCRADSVGLLGEDMKEGEELLKTASLMPLLGDKDRPYVAVASEEGIFVNLHLGEAGILQVYEKVEGGYSLVDERETPARGLGDYRWIEMAKSLKDCHTILVSGAGENPVFLLKSMGIKVILMRGLVEEGLDAAFTGKPLNNACKPVKSFKCGEACSGNGTGCG